VFDYLLKPEQREVFEFKERSRRPPRNRMNALLSFLYTLITHDCVSALETVGLDPQMGFFHQLRPGRPALALDLMEEFRAIFADRLAVTLINRLQIQKDDFDERIGGAVYLNDKGRRTVLTAYRQRKLETVQHPLYKSAVAIGLLPCEQARLLARFLRGDVEHYVPFLTR
jgi:CRISPR-associated protein Cas1